MTTDRFAPTDGVQVWAPAVPATLSRDAFDASDLDDRERRRMAAFLHREDAVSYGFAHVLLRSVLASRTGIPPDRLSFARGLCPHCGEPHGRPVVRGSALRFSLARTRRTVLIAIGTVPVGVDVETVPERATAEQIATMLHPSENDAITSTPSQDRAAAFTRLWVRKEAYLKGLGTGLGRDLARDDVRGNPAGWRLADLPVGEGQAAAVAVAVRTDAP